MLLYLSTNTHCDILFAVSQVARFSQNPRKKSHATAGKTIVPYLHKSCDKGTIVALKKSLQVDCYVDADFGGLYRRDPDSEPSAFRPRSGYIIFLGNFNSEDIELSRLEEKNDRSPSHLEIPAHA